MSKQLLIDYNLFKVSPKMITESQEKNNGKVIVTVGDPLVVLNALERVVVVLIGCMS